MVKKLENFSFGIVVITVIVWILKGFIYFWDKPQTVKNVLTFFITNWYMVIILIIVGFISFQLEDYNKRIKGDK